MNFNHLGKIYQVIQIIYVAFGAVNDLMDNNKPDNAEIRRVDKVEE